MSEKTLFSEQPLHEVFQNHIASIKQEIDTIPENQFIQTPDEELIEYALSRLEMGTLKIYPDRKEMVTHETKVDVRYERQLFHRDTSKPLLVDGIKVIISFPYAGEYYLWECQPSIITFSPPRADIQQVSSEEFYGNVILTFEQASDSKKNVDSISKELNKAIKEISDYIDCIGKDIEKHNGELEGHIVRSIQSRKNRLGKHSAIINTLNIPLKKKPGAPDYDLLPIRKRIIKPLPDPKKGNKEYGIEDDYYEYILQIIRHEGRTYETTPKTYAIHDEEELRDILLAHLNGHLEGQASAETFRKKGKTDICIEHENRAAFVAECKIWKGKKAILDAVDQLLGYLTWRDCKASLIIFNKDVGGFTGIQNKLSATLETHQLCLRGHNSNQPGEWRFLFRSQEDEEREVILHVFLFNLFVKQD